MKKLTNKSKKALRHLMVQFAIFLLQNPLLSNFASGKIYQGGLKRMCTPGLNCYSCPAAVTSCPIGSMQFFLAGVKHSLGLYITGFLLTTSVLCGRFICGYVCPMGLLQDLLYKIKTPKLNVRLRYARYIKYVILVLFVFILPFLVINELSGLGAPWFCKYICPSGTIFASFPLLAANDSLRGLAGAQFLWKASLAIGLIILTTVVFRFFCRVLCPLGAIYSMFNGIAFFRMHLDEDKCVSCGKCHKACHIQIDPVKQPNSPECVRCAKCMNACGVRALRYRKN